MAEMRRAVFLALITKLSGLFRWERIVGLVQQLWSWKTLATGQPWAPVLS
jgi:hypothetical protein